jgi:predicted enzyme related to lactoylglutathione lyase
MSKPPGSVIGFDLTVPDADGIRDFYAAVIGWSHGGFDMGGYSDYFMKIDSTGEPVAGLCHKRGENADLPPAWLTYIYVADLEASVAKVVELGGEQVTPIKGEPGAWQYCVIRDPAGAVLALTNSDGTE